MDEQKNVVYLFGAGASHACVKAIGSAHGILMSDLNQELAEELRSRVTSRKYRNHAGLKYLVNNVIDESTDFEQICTFLDESTSQLHRRFAQELRRTFEKVLSKRLRTISKEAGKPPVNLYEVLLDMHSVPNFSEVLRGCLTLNYDDYLEHAVELFKGSVVDLGIAIEPSPEQKERTTTILKLHGSFNWKEVWPIRLGGREPLWIPPGIQKAKQRYPFNVLWGRARELLNCDVLRIIGCRLSANDWDLISMLFGTCYGTDSGRAYQVEVVDSPRLAFRLQKDFPFLNVQSILDVEPIGSALVSEFGGMTPKPFAALTPAERERVMDNAKQQNWFYVWLKQKLEAIYKEIGSVATDHGAAAKFLEGTP